MDRIDLYINKVDRLLYEFTIIDKQCKYDLMRSDFNYITESVDYNTNEDLNRRIFMESEAKKDGIISKIINAIMSILKMIKDTIKNIFVGKSKLPPQTPISGIDKVEEKRKSGAIQTAIKALKKKIPTIIGVASFASIAAGFKLAHEVDKKSKAMYKAENDTLQDILWIQDRFNNTYYKKLTSSNNQGIVMADLMLLIKEHQDMLDDLEWMAKELEKNHENIDNVTVSKTANLIKIVSEKIKDRIIDYQKAYNKAYDAYDPKGDEISKENRDIFHAQYTGTDANKSEEQKSRIHDIADSAVKKQADYYKWYDIRAALGLKGNKPK